MVLLMNKQCSRCGTNVSLTDLVGTARSRCPVCACEIPNESPREEKQDAARNTPTLANQTPEILPKSAELDPLRAYLLATASLYLAVCAFFCVWAAWLGPGGDARWGPAFPMFIFSKLALPGGVLAMLIVWPVGRGVGLTNQAAGRVIRIEVLLIVLCWVYVLFGRA